MVNAKKIGMFVGVALPSLFLMLLSVDAPLVVGQDVFVISLLQFLVIGGYMFKN